MLIHQTLFKWKSCLSCSGQTHRELTDLFMGSKTSNCFVFHFLLRVCWCYICLNLLNLLQMNSLFPQYLHFCRIWACLSFFYPVCLVLSPFSLSSVFSLQNWTWIHFELVISRMNLCDNHSLLAQVSGLVFQYKLFCTVTVWNLFSTLNFCSPVFLKVLPANET